MHLIIQLVRLHHPAAINYRSYRSSLNDLDHQVGMDHLSIVCCANEYVRSHVSGEILTDILMRRAQKLLRNFCCTSVAVVVFTLILPKIKSKRVRGHTKVLEPYTGRSEKKTHQTKKAHKRSGINAPPSVA